MKKRIFALVLATLMLLFTCGCGMGQTASEYTVFEGNEEAEAEGEQSDAVSEDGTATGGNTGGSASTGGKKPNTKPTTGSSSAVGKDGKQVKLANPIYVANGSEQMDQNLDFGGKTFRMAKRDDPIYKTARFSRLVAAFEKKFNCEIEEHTLEFNNYAISLASAKASENPYDIIFCHGSRFPEIPLAGLVADLSPYLTTADYDTGNGGIDIAKSSYFAMGKNLYGVVGGEDAVYPDVIFYNKALYQKSGLEDPYELYKQGKWTWSKFREQGKKVTDASKGVYYGDWQFIRQGTVHSLGMPIMTWKNNKVVNNLKETRVIKGYQLMYDLFNKSKICSQNYAKDANSEFYDGLTYCTPEESQKYEGICATAANSPAFNRDPANVGIVPFPQDSSSAKLGYPCGWYTAIMAGSSSSDPRVAVAFAKFWSTYNDPVKDKYELSDEYKALVKKLISGEIINLQGGYTGSDGTASYTLFIYPIAMDVALGSDVAAKIDEQLPKINACVEYTMNKK